MVMQLRRKAEKKQKNIDASEAYNLWDILKASNTGLERIEIWDNYAHDTDLKYLLRSYSKTLRKQVKILERKMEEFGLKGPDGQVTDVRSGINSQVLRDQYIANDFFLLAQESVEMLLKAIRTSTTNDSVRSFLIMFVKQVIDSTDNLVKYLKARGWLEEPPLYPYVPADINDKLDTGEAFHLWDHLTFRNDNIEQTQVFYAFANDGDFKVLLKKGLQDILRRQNRTLEEELKYFGMPIPVRPPTIMPSSESTELLKDDNMFRQLLVGIQGAAIMHALTFKQCVTNDRVRKIFKQLLLDEIDMIDRIIKFGKVKGWLNPVPEYGVSK